MGIKVAPFKKGPDYIDAGWLAFAAGRACYNLDTFLCNQSQVKNSFQKNSANSDIAIIEGNRGLYDGIDLDGRTSTAEIAKLLNIPVLLILDCTKSTRTMAALLMGCLHFDPHINIIGVVLNRVAGKRHENKVRDNIKKFCNIPVFGSIPKLKSKDFPERHMGLVPCEEHSLAIFSLESAVKIAQDNINLDLVFKTCTAISKNQIVQNNQPKNNHYKDNHIQIKKSKNQKIILSKNISSKPETDNNFLTPCSPVKYNSPIIGVIKDSAFQFYYPDNLEALEKKGAKIKFISPLKEKIIPKIDAIYMGGGFPETHAQKLAQNIEFRENLKQLAEKGLPIYAECGGFIFLGKSIKTIDGKIFPMTGVFSVDFGFSKRPVGHGYTKVKVVHDNPFFTKGQVIKGHEFRYSSILNIDFKKKDMAFKMERGKGIINKMDGLCKKNVLATYTHILATGTSAWADGFIKKTLEFMKIS